ncbi:MAG: anaerobic ribonucleoside-triphosphate reductase activating protein [Candidatus Cryptobacteroides sp.]
MIKYVPQMTSVVIEEIPDRVALAVEISNCQGNCVGCHSPFLKEDIGEILCEEVIDSLLADNFGVDCFLFLGEGRDKESLLSLASYVRSKGLKTALYSGRKQVEKEFYLAFDYVKVGPYIEEFGPLNAETTNQRLYMVTGTEGGVPQLADITSRFWHRGIDPLSGKAGK